MRRAVALMGALLIACGQGAAPTVTPTLVQSSAAPATTAPASTSAPSAIATSNPTRAEVFLRFAPGTNISDVDDIYDMLTHLKNTPGIHDGFGNEIEITVVYDPRLITVEKIRALLEEMSFPTLPPS